MVKAEWRLTSALISSLAPLAASSEVMHEPLWVENLSPLAQLVALPSQRSADIKEGISVTLHADVATHFVSQVSDSERVFFDGETQAHNVNVRWGLSPRWELSAHIRSIQHDGGFVDSYVNRWHDFFGMSDGGRSALPEDQIRFQFDRDGEQVLLDRSVSGQGDTTFELSYLSERQQELQIGYAVGYKASTGASDDWLGSGATDLYGVARFSGAHQGNLPLYWHGQLGVTRAGDSALLGAQQKDWLWFTGLSAEWLLNDRWSVIAQLDSHSALAASDLDAVGDAAGMFSLGLRRQLGRQWALDVSFAEDIIVESAPDIIFQASLHFRP
jgi:hypothetical protein